mmetsp:Transcript_28538/g.32619  ORF Transcript_28538/g.32619 Transcript_28538/m.32619 type:complete len:194 (+) Transcript_28538:3052-3633(+)
MWIVSAKNTYNMNLFEFAIDKKNIDVAMKLIESCEILDVISSFPLEPSTLNNLLDSEHILIFLKCVVKNKKKIEDLITKSPKSEPIGEIEHLYPEVFKGLAPIAIDVENSINNKEQAKENENDFDSNSHYVYTYYQRDAFLKKLGKDIELFNLLFFSKNKYVLDELVTRLKVSQIKELNKEGFIIGKLICYTR